ncbi:MAG: FG-GAP-like repeat-containing protein [Candidatus Acidiferrum sp.]
MVSPAIVRVLTGPGAGVRFSFLREKTQGHRLNIPRKKRRPVDLSRREFLLRSCQGASLAFLPAGLGLPYFDPLVSQESLPPSNEFHVHPHYRTPRDLDAVLRKVEAGSDDFVTEKYHDRVAAILREWSSELLESPQKTVSLEKAMTANFAGASPTPSASLPIRSGSTLQVSRMNFSEETPLEREAFLSKWRSGMTPFAKLITAEFQVTSIRVGSSPQTTSDPGILLKTRVRFELVGAGNGFYREQRVGNWELDWELLASGDVRLSKWRTLDEMRGHSLAPVFVDIAAQTFDGNPSYASQLIPGSDYWRTILDGACGIDIYGHNGVSFADIDGDGFDDLYVCQPAGLPNRLFRNRGDGSFEDITAISGLGILENTACALFADFDNDGRQDVVVVRTGGPLLFLNEGGGKFRAKPDAFQFVNPPQGAFTGAAIADYDRDGWLDIYFCLYIYYQGTDQYRYPSPYYDAENGPPNFMMRNHRDGTFRDVTKESGLDRNNTRFSFCCGWGDHNGDQWPDLYVVNDFGRKNLYRNNGNGTFTDIGADAGVEDIGAGMSVCWLDYDNDGKQDLYVGDMWTAAGVRISEQNIFQKNTSEEARGLYRKHAMGNSMFRNRGSGHFEDVSSRAGTAMGRWAWSSDAWDFDHDGFPDLYIANGMISGTTREDLNSFFWRQVVANSPRKPGPNYNYDQGWSAVNELIRSDGTWSGFERNVFYANNRDGTFSDVSGIVGLDFIEDGRSFALADFDHDGRVEVILKNRNSPQLRVLKNVMAELGPAIAFRLSGKKSNRDAIGASVMVETQAGRQTRWLQAGSGFLAQHSKELFFGLGETKGLVSATIRWPSGFEQTLPDIPINHRIWVEEGSPPSRTEPFKTAEGARAALAPETRTLPTSFATWLLAPVAAPDFSVRDLAGNVQVLSARSKLALLYFWSTASPTCEKELAELDHAYAQWTKEGLHLLAVNADDLPIADGSSALTPYRRFSFPILADVPDVVAVYNILYRSLFDRHRDLSLPTSFLIDETGAIVRIYVGPAQPEQIAADCRQIPRTASERMAKALPFPGISETTEFGRNYLSYGSVFFERGYMQEAERFFQLALRDDPSSAEAYYGLGSVYLQKEDAAEAHISFERAVQLQAHYPGTLPNAWNNLGILAARGGHTDEGIRDFQRALKIDPDHLIALQNLGNAYRQARRWEDAKSILQRALQISPDSPEGNYGLGMVFAQLDDTKQAYEYLKKALAARPAYPEALNNLGILYLRTGRQDEAESSFKESIRVAPAYDQAYLNLARLYAIEGDSQRARNVLLELLKQHPGHAQAEEELRQLPR